MATRRNAGFRLRRRSERPSQPRRRPSARLFGKITPRSVADVGWDALRIIVDSPRWIAIVVCPGAISPCLQIGQVIKAPPSEVAFPPFRVGLVHRYYVAPFGPASCPTTTCRPPVDGPSRSASSTATCAAGAEAASSEQSRRRLILRVKEIPCRHQQQGSFDPSREGTTAPERNVRSITLLAAARRTVTGGRASCAGHPSPAFPPGPIRWARTSTTQGVQQPRPASVNE